jgi:hypothetical protein
MAKEKPIESNSPPVVVVCPNTIEKKMDAMLALARGMEQLAQEIGKVNVHVSISGCTIVGAQVGIAVELE